MASRVRQRPGRWRGQGPNSYKKKPNDPAVSVKNGSLLSVQGGPGAAAPGSPGDWRGVWELVGEARLGYRKESFCLAWGKEGVSLRLILERLRTHPWGV